MFPSARTLEKMRSPHRGDKRQQNRSHGERNFERCKPEGFKGQKVEEERTVESLKAKMLGGEREERFLPPGRNDGLV